MADEEAKVGQDNPGPEDRLAAVEARLRSYDALSKRMKLVQRLGTLLILFFALLFVYRLYSHFHGYVVAFRIPAEREVIVKEFLSQAKAEPIILGEAQALAKDVEKTIWPKILKDVIAEIGESKPELEKMANEMSDRLVKHVETRVTTQLTEALAQSYDDLEKDIRASFGDLTEEEFERDFEAAKGIFVTHFTNALEERMAKVQSGLEGLRETVRTHYGKGFAPGLNKEERLRAAEMEFLEAMIALIVYELKPELGDEPAQPTANQGG
ncbi:MAG: hypothetical protein KAI66_08800 [Lentisphaeria bacterium]|nr:hypothetical protein [Lentisphaeria bacterium]